MGRGLTAKAIAAQMVRTAGINANKDDIANWLITAKEKPNRHANNYQQQQYSKYAGFGLHYFIQFPQIFINADYPPDPSALSSDNFFFQYSRIARFFQVSKLILANTPLTFNIFVPLCLGG